jgi:dihydroflavonol-4-reductase
MNLHADNAQTRTLFNWTPMPLKESVLDSAAAVKAITRS